MNNLLYPLARFLVALIFVMSGVGKLFSFSDTTTFMQQHGFIWAPLFLVGAIILEIGGGLLLLAGLKTRVAATALIVFLIPATLIFHVPNMAETPEMISVLKNLAILGALIKFYLDGAGKFSVDGSSENSITRNPAMLNT